MYLQEFTLWWTPIMNGKTWLWGLLAVVVLAGGCGEDVKKRRQTKE
jgi:hypothetical protein